MQCVPLDLGGTNHWVVGIEHAIQTSAAKHNEFLAELGLPLLPAASFNPLIK